MSKHLGILLGGAALVAALDVAPIFAQSFGARLVQSWSGYELLERPFGGAIEITTPRRGPLSVRVSYLHRTDSRSGGFSCCPGNELESDFTLQTLEVGPILTFPVRPAVDMRVGAFVAWNRMDGEVREPRTNQKFGFLLLPESPGAGWAASLGSRWSPFSDRWYLVMEGRLEDARLGEACGTDVWTPFCDSERFASLTVGLELDLGPR